MKIINLQAENIKKLVAIEIKPDGNLVEITGKNGQGKTSVLDSIWWALAGASHIQAEPIRKGSDKAKIRLDLGEVIVTRTFKKTGEDEKITSSIKVENAEGAKFSSPQTLLDDLLGELSFDPLAFSRMEPKKQFELLRSFVPNVDFDAFDTLSKEDYDARTEVNRKAKEARTMADKIGILSEAPKELIDESALVEKLQKAADHNSEIEARKAKRERAKSEIEDIRKKVQELRATADQLEKNAAEIQGKLDQAEELPKPIDTAALRKEIDEARDRNKIFHLKEDKERWLSEASEYEKRSKELTKRMEDREKEKRDAIAKAELPVKGISFGDNEILLNAVPFNQASDAEQLRTSVAIAMALNPKLRVIRVRDGSLLDEESLKLVSKMANERDYQVWIERVDSSGKVGFVLEDGRLKAKEG